MRIPQRIDQLDQHIAAWMERHGLRLLRWSLAVVFIWFGALKPFGVSPANDLVRNTIVWFSPDWFIPLLGVWEMTIGVCLLIRPLIRVALLLLALQMPGTALPLILLPDVCFTHPPFGLTLEGQYIIKNLTLVAGAIVVGGTARQQARQRRL